MVTHHNPPGLTPFQSTQMSSNLTTMVSSNNSSTHLRTQISRHDKVGCWCAMLFRSLSYNKKKSTLQIVRNWNCAVKRHVQKKAAEVLKGWRMHTCTVEKIDSIVVVIIQIRIRLVNLPIFNHLQPLVVMQTKLLSLNFTAPFLIIFLKGKVTGESQRNTGQTNE